MGCSTQYPSPILRIVYNLTIFIGLFDEVLQELESQC